MPGIEKKETQKAAKKARGWRSSSLQETREVSSADNYDEQRLIRSFSDTYIGISDHMKSSSEGKSPVQATSLEITRESYLTGVIKSPDPHSVAKYKEISGIDQKEKQRAAGMTRGWRSVSLPKSKGVSYAKALPSIRALSNKNPRVMKSDPINSPSEGKPPQDCVVEIPDVMEEGNKLPKPAGNLSATSSQNKEIIEEECELPKAGSFSVNSSQNKAMNMTTAFNMYNPAKELVDDDSEAEVTKLTRNRGTSLTTNKEPDTTGGTQKDVNKTTLNNTILETTETDHDDSVNEATSQKNTKEEPGHADRRGKEQQIGTNATSQESTNEQSDTKGGSKNWPTLPPNANWTDRFNTYMETTRRKKAESSSQADSRETIHRLQPEYIDLIYNKQREAEAAELREIKTIPLNSSGDTALHLAVCLNRTKIFNKLVGEMNAEDLEIKNDDGNTAFCMAASYGKLEFVRTMLDLNSGLVKIRGHFGMLPILMAALNGHHEVCTHLFLRTSIESFDYTDVVDLFFASLHNSIYDTAFQLLKDFPELAASRYQESTVSRTPGLAVSRDEYELTALHVLARKPLEEFRKHNEDEVENYGSSLIERLWLSTEFMTRKELLELTSKPSGVLSDAAKSGNVKIFEFFSQHHSNLFTTADPQGRNVFHIAVLYRQKDVFSHLIDNAAFKDLLMQAVDHDRNNILHLAGMKPPDERYGSSRPDIQMQRELLWFKEVENRVPTALKTMRNKEGHTPRDIFDSQHKELIDKGKVAAKDTANYGMVVATIVATIVFAASFTLQGSNVSSKADSLILQKKEWYIIFILCNSVALFSSSLSTVFFLSVLTSGFNEHEFISSLQKRLMCGVTTLYVAITTMVVAFIAASFLIFNHISTWVAVVVAVLGFVTVALFAVPLRYRFNDLIKSLYWSRYFFQHPTNDYQHSSFHKVVFGLQTKTLLYLRQQQASLRQYLNASA